MFNIRLTSNTCVIYATQQTLPVPVGILKHLKIQSTEFVKSQRKKLFFFFREQFTLKLAYMYITPETFFLSKTIKNSSYLSFIIIPTKTQTYQKLGNNLAVNDSLLYMIHYNNLHQQLEIPSDKNRPVNR